MPNNIEGRGLTDREMLQLSLELEKGRCRSIVNTMLEAEHVELRNLYQQCLQQAYQNQNDIYQIMNNRGWYKVQPSNTQQIKQTQEMMQNNLHPDQQF